MKKVYEKPWVHMERFELAEHIAACAWDYQNDKDKNACYANGKLEGFDGNIQIFTATANCQLVDDNACTYTQEDSSATFNS